MHINIRGSKVEITPAIKTYIEEKVGRVAKYFESKEITATVVCRVNGINQTVEVTVPAPKMILRAEVTTKDLYDAIDKVSDKLERQIRKNKTRMNKKKGKDVSQGFNLEFEMESYGEETEEKIVRRKVISMKPMDEEEAILQMELIDHDFFVFRSADTDEINILYKRKDGNYGIIETK